MLLLIALANSAGVFLPDGPGFSTDPHGPERGWNLVLNVFVHARAYPMFAVLFGYGLVQLARRQDAATGDPRIARRVLLRRNAWLVVFGFAHAALLYSGDFLGGYGLVGIAFTLLLLRRGDRVHHLALGYQAISLVYAAVLAVLVLVGLGHRGHATLGATGEASLSATGYLPAMLARLAEWPVHTATLFGFVLIVWVGAWAARRRILEEPERHVRLLLVAAAGGLGVAFAGGIPMGLFSAGWLHPDRSTLGLISQLHQASGQFGGVGFVAAFGLIALALRRRHHDPRTGIVVGSLAALGQRSLSGYLFQSVCWLLLASSYTLALKDATGSPTFVAAGCSLGVWLVSLAVARWLDSRGRRGPAETLLRRLAYGRRRHPADRPDRPGRTPRRRVAR
jgi:uncharacterized membrane protein YeiB